MNPPFTNDSTRGNSCLRILQNICRRKPPPTMSPRGFSRCLTTSELTSLGVGAILGAGIYVVAGQVAAGIAGPSTVLSFIIAAFASILSGLAYAEFGSRVPRTTGSAYAYSYVAVGEIWAYVIGWNLLLEYMIGTAADASALSASLENLATGIFGNVSHVFSPISPIIGDHRPDLFSFVLTLMVTFLLAIGVRDSSRCTLICNIINGLIICFIVIFGAFYAKPERWKGYQNFFPFGIGGTLSGAASCFYAFVGFDIIATTGEEAADASKSIPIAIVTSLIIVLTGYLSVSVVLTMMISYKDLDTRSPLASAFEKVGVPWAGHIISAGAVFGLTSSLIGSLFPLPRIVFAMANDGLLFSFFAKINKKTEVPINATIYPGILTACFALFFDLQDLVEMMSIGTLLAYTLVSFCILILRYQPSEIDSNNVIAQRDDITLTQDNENVMNNNIYNQRLYTWSQEDTDTLQDTNTLDTDERSYLKKEPTKQTYIKAVTCCAIICLCFLLCAILIIFDFDDIQKGMFWPILVLSIIAIVTIIAFVTLHIQPQNSDMIPFKAPFVPVLPVTAILFNIFLILKLSILTWIRFLIWMLIGFLLYITYSYRYSKQGHHRPV